MRQARARPPWPACSSVTSAAQRRLTGRSSFRWRKDWKRKNGHVELHVRDDGPGFAQEFIARAFERFSRSDQARAGTGAGLGLAIVDVIARAHDGSAHAANLEGGADVWLQLPEPT